VCVCADDIRVKELRVWFSGYWRYFSGREAVPVPCRRNHRTYAGSVPWIFIDASAPLRGSARSLCTRPTARGHSTWRVRIRRHGRGPWTPQHPLRLRSLRRFAPAKLEQWSH